MHIDWTSKRFYIIPGFILLFLIFLVLFIKIPQNADINFLKNSVNTILFAVIAISSVGMGLSYSDHELVKLKEKRTEINARSEISKALSDSLILDINSRIKKTERIFGFHQRFNFIIIVAAFTCILTNEVVLNFKCQYCLKLGGFILSFLYIAAFLDLMIYKRGLLDVITNKYEECIKNVKLINDGDFSNLMPPH